MAHCIANSTQSLILFFCVAMNILRRFSSVRAFAVHLTRAVQDVSDLCMSDIPAIQKIAGARSKKSTYSRGIRMLQADAVFPSLVAPDNRAKSSGLSRVRAAMLVYARRLDVVDSRKL